MLLSNAYNVENYNRDSSADGYIRPKLSQMYTSNSVTFKKIFSNVVTVGAGKDYTTISAAVSAADPGDVILIYPGTYNETVTITKLVHLRGVSDGIAEDNTYIYYNTGTTIYIKVPSSDTMYIENLFISNTAASSVALGVDSSTSNVDLVVNRCYLKASSSVSAYSLAKSAVSANNSITASYCTLYRGYAHILRCGATDTFNNIAYAGNSWKTYLCNTFAAATYAIDGTANYGVNYGTGYLDAFVEEYVASIT